jgi:hypothetical protein
MSSVEENTMDTRSGEFEQVLRTQRLPNSELTREDQVRCWVQDIQRTSGEIDTESIYSGTEPSEFEEIKASECEEVNQGDLFSVSRSKIHLTNELDETKAALKEMSARSTALSFELIKAHRMLRQIQQGLLDTKAKHDGELNSGETAKYCDPDELSSEFC